MSRHLPATHPSERTRLETIGLYTHDSTRLKTIEITSSLLKTIQNDWATAPSLSFSIVPYRFFLEGEGCIFLYVESHDSRAIDTQLFFKGRLNTDTSPQNFWTTFLDNDMTDKFKKSAVASAIAIPLPLCFSCFVPLRRFRENLTKRFYFYLSCTCDSPSGTPSVISLALTPTSMQS